MKTDADIFGFILNNIHKFGKMLTEYDKYPCFSKIIRRNKEVIIWEKI